MGAKVAAAPRLGLRENLAQFSLLVLVNAFVGAMVGMERTLLPAIAQDEFDVAARTGVLSFIVAFGISKALTNYFAGRVSEQYGRKPVLILGWLVAAPVPFALMWAPSWGWIVAANVLLGVSQGLTWSMTVIMKIDLAGPKRRGMAMGLNEFAGYFAVAGSALMTGALAAHYGLRPAPFAPGIAFVALGLLLSVVLVRETLGHAKAEAERAEPAGARTQGAERTSGAPQAAAAPPLTGREIFMRTTLRDRNLSSVTQAGFVNNLNDGMAWGLFPMLFLAADLSLEQIGWLAAIYPAAWGVGQLVTGALSDRTGRKPLIVAGMGLQAAAIVGVAVAGDFAGFARGALALGVGTAMVYPTLMAAIGDVAAPAWRASAVGVYRLWRDLGYAAGAVFAGLVADQLGVRVAVLCVAGLTMVSAAVAGLRMTETLRR